jgi:lipid-binding SYLF domain-containing protein
MRKLRIIYYLLFALWLIVSDKVWAEGSENLVKEVPDLIKSVLLVNISTAILQSKHIPTAVLHSAQGIMVIPKITTGGFLITASVGQGMVVVRQGLQWSQPLLVTLSGAGAGLKAGLKSGDMVLVFTRRRDLDSLLARDLKIGADVQVSIGPQSLSTGSQIVNSKVYDYSQETGLFAGIGIESIGVQVDSILNEGLYGKKVDKAMILAGEVVPKAEIAGDAVNNLGLWLMINGKWRMKVFYDNEIDAVYLQK